MQNVKFKAEPALSKDDFKKAVQYLLEDDMKQYAPEGVELATWLLLTTEGGLIFFSGGNEEEVLDWIDGQNSDGLGEGFFQRFGSTIERV